MAEQYINGTSPWIPPWENQNISTFSPNYYSYYLYLSKLSQYNGVQNNDHQPAPLMVSDFSTQSQDLYDLISGRQCSRMKPLNLTQETYLSHRYFQSPDQPLEAPLIKVLEKEGFYTPSHQPPPAHQNIPKSKENHYSNRSHNYEFSKKIDSSEIPLDLSKNKDFKEYMQLNTHDNSPVEPQDPQIVQKPQESTPKSTLQIPTQSASSQIVYQKPPFTMVTLCHLAIKSTKTEKATAEQIATFAKNTFPFYNGPKKNCINSIRSTLTRCFVKSEEKDLQSSSFGNRGRNGNYWLISPTKSKTIDKDLMNLWLNNHIAIKATTPNPKFVENLFQKFDVSDNRSTVKSENRFPQPKVPCISNENLKFTDIPTSILESMDLDSEMMATDLIFGDQSCKTVVFDVSKHFDKDDEFSIGGNVLETQNNIGLPESGALSENKHESIEGSKMTFKTYQRPMLSNTELVVLAMKNSSLDFVTVGDVYKFIEGFFPFYQHMNEKSNDLWKRAVKHVVSENSRKKLFFRHVNQVSDQGDLHQKGSGQKHYYYSYSLVPEWRQKLIESAQKSCKKYQAQIRRAMKNPDLFDKTFL